MSITPVKRATLPARTDGTAAKEAELEKQIGSALGITTTQNLIGGNKPATLASILSDTSAEEDIQLSEGDQGGDEIPKKEGTTSIIVVKTLFSAPVVGTFRFSEAYPGQKFETGTEFADVPLAAAEHLVQCGYAVARNVTAKRVVKRVDN